VPTSPKSLITDLIFMHENSQSCLSKLPRDVLDAFIDSFEFDSTSGQLVKAKYSALGEFLSDEEILEAFGYLGIDAKRFKENFARG
jgi:hypothetical protein